MDKQNISCDQIPTPVGSYAHARKVGDWLYLSALGPHRAGSDEVAGLKLNPDGRVHSHDIVMQTRATLENIEAVLNTAGGSLKNVVDVVVYLTDIKNDHKKFCGVFNEVFAGIDPARTIMEVGFLDGKAAIQIKATAFLG